MIPSGEPRDGDFVAYLEELERQRQLAHLPARPTTQTADTPTLAAGKGAAPGGASSALPATLVGSVVLSLAGVFLLLLGLIGDGGLIATAVGAFLAWRGLRALLREARRGRLNPRAAPARRPQTEGGRQA